MKRVCLFLRSYLKDYFSGPITYGRKNLGLEIRKFYAFVLTLPLIV